jgi:hypothetical protein
VQMEIPQPSDPLHPTAGLYSYPIACPKRGSSNFSY